MKILPATEANIAKAAKAILAGKLVVMPTETVYGLAADAANPEAVRRIFVVKDRPAENPLIVHIADAGQIEAIASAFPEAAQTLAGRFWPGPLTLVLPSAGSVAQECTGSAGTIAIRMPAHPVALALIRTSGRPLAAPSANRFMKLSPTKAEHIDPEIAKQVAMILDGGPSEIGVESTVVDCTNSSPRILRPGGVSRGDIEAALGGPLGSLPSHLPRSSPGMYSRHYAPRAKVLLVTRLGPEMTGLTFDEPANDRQIKMPLSPSAYASILYDCLHRLDFLGVEELAIQAPPEEPEWEAVQDRLRKASA
ncbi:MAG TPA: L-threonylcarbamoyladenylate synthase [Fimbriimonadaceae bacterium]|nr:L-threonylcarbamoyladenylate synthase [Fimbriimonadaceae bacterium]